ncbi:glycosyl hydrolase family 28 protein [Arcticibacterium luteifluviistationis]|uniref:GDSL family lipase n=1 Tax=Arcticibacterium luteifluviistationis TaxID=1784714 RepID=A0A2Z4GH36_9BACT|nr:glycosyl hydrolase family 28 protein [Arcticibacterium luteifluviistationis]AWW00239.1 GDSL family lipase [Arcticibacterium luteifluviistationis]
MIRKRLYLLLCLFVITAFKSTEEKNVRIFMIGDSTMANKKMSDAPETGWGQVFNEVFTDKVEIQNHARNGRSTKSFRDLGHWTEVDKQLKPGDYVFIQFGHNDQKEKDPARYADPHTDYKENLRRYVKETQEKGAIAILLTPVSRRKFDKNGNFIDQHGDYPLVVRELAKELNVPMIDMHQKSMDLLKEMSVEDTKDLYMHVLPGIYDKFPNGLVDNTHFTPYGAEIMSKMAAAELVTLGHPLKNFLLKSPYPTKYTYELPTVNETAFKKDTLNIIKFGAQSGGLILCHTAINSAISAASENGGGVVLIPKGFWLCGPIDLKSNVNLHLEEGAFIQFSDNRNDYPIVETTWEGQKAYRCHAPLWGVDLVNVGITGKGIMDGAGQVWKQVRKSKLTNSQWKTLINSGGVLDEKKIAWYPSEQSKYGNENKEWTNQIVEGKTKEDYEAIRDFLRPNMVSLTNCRNVLIEGVTFLNSPAWTLHPLLCENIIIRNVNVKNPWYGQNNDALDVESCTNGIIEDCTFDTGDDAITIKSGRDESGRLRGVPTSNFIIRNTTVYHGHGGFVIGSEMSGGVNNLFVNNCNFLGTDIGLRFKTTRGRGGIVENIFISDINMNNIQGEAVRFNMYYEVKEPGEAAGLVSIEEKPFDDETPIFRNFVIDRIYCKGADAAIMMRGIPEAQIENVTISNANITSKNGIQLTEAKNINLVNVNLTSSHKTVIQLNNVEDLNIDNLAYSENKDTFMEVNGANTKDVVIKNTSKEGAVQRITFLNQASKNVVKWK